MKRSIRIFFFLLIFLCLFSCGDGFKYTQIFKEKELKISYIDSRKIGRRVLAKLKVGKLIYEYAIYFGHKGSQMHIIKYSPQNNMVKDKSRLDTYREMEFLVTDTLKNNPNYLGNEVDGYYDPTFFKGRYEVEKLKKIISPVSVQEYNMFQKIKDVLSDKQIDFLSIDSTKIFGWFKYEF